MSIVGKSKEYDSEIVASFMSDLFLEHKKYQNRMLQLECEFERYETNDTHRGKAAEASKEYIREGEKRFQYEILDANSMLLHLYDHMRDMFSSKVDSHPRAKIKTNVLLEIERHYKNYYHDVKESGDDIETRARAIESKFGKYGKVTIPDFEPSKMAYKKFCGGDSENSGYLYECIDKFVRFDRDECEYAESMQLPEKIDELDTRLTVSSNALSMMHAVFFGMKHYSTNLASASVGTPKYWYEKDGFTQNGAGEYNELFDKTSLFFWPTKALWDFRYGKDWNYHVDTHNSITFGTCWQQFMGYMELYDAGFDFFTEMRSDQMEFSYGGENYTIWYWKGDYMNLGAGGECGIYKDTGYFKECATNMNLHMTIKVKYVDGTESEIWEDDTWWITDFNPKQNNYGELSLIATTVTYTIDMSFLTDSEWNDFLEIYGEKVKVLSDGDKIIEFNL
ncbi:LXG domain of WXG superfamily protein [Butyrivibrio hungatei DSM 14810]|uniref:LXG domain of WXG superfamily protein n=1 Tax=Butyrivibrio hungatei DSM 14810 TaxID=1121132 RepID=A0A1M7S5G4_9FIRM|nr:DUF4474 domain-containing protein [Butyrivibrio hungatei]SHN53706.1 LXG domain of WXG superfamily protein [Butyrivibrio hungatei DSM 14810]